MNTELSILPDTKIAVILDKDLETWQKLNVTAFLVSGIAATIPTTIGDPYVDASGKWISRHVRAAGYGVSE